MSLSPLASRSVPGRPLTLGTEDAAPAVASTEQPKLNPETAALIERAKNRAGIRHDLSPLQTDIAREAVEGTGHVVIEAVAGSGKSFTLRLLAYVLSLAMGQFRGLAVAFNKSIADELGKKLKGTNFWAKTMHSQAYFNLRRGRPDLTFNIEGDKYRDICAEYVENSVTVEIPASVEPDPIARERMQAARKKEIARNLQQLVGLVRLNLISPSDIEAVTNLALHHDLDAEACAEHVAPVLTIGNRLADETGLIDFDDMLYLPLLWKVRFTKFKIVLADECQDFNPAQLEVILRCLDKNGRIFFVGDRKQAIYGFAGADHRSFQSIIERSKATVMPLSVTYRCPVSHVRLAQQIVPHIQAAPGAAEGTVRRIERDDVAKEVRPGNLILCRLNAPLVSLCIEMIAQKIQARVKGADIGKRMIGILRQIEQIEGYSFDQIGQFIDTWAANQIAFLESKGASDSSLSRITDMRDALDVCVRSFAGCRSVDCLADQIAALFADETAAVWLSSVHRAKGLEAEQVMILRDDKMPLRFPDQQDWELEQEWNLRYVALTRSTDTLTFIND